MILTTMLDDKTNVKAGLITLRQWKAELDAHLQCLDLRFYQLDAQHKLSDRRSQKMIEQKQAQITTMRDRAHILRVKEPFVLSLEAVKRVGMEVILANLQSQYAALTKEERLEWLTHSSFILTTDARKLVDMLDEIQEYTQYGEQRNLLIGGESGSGKTTLLNFYAAHYAPIVEAERNRVNVIQVQAVQNDTSAKSLLQEMVLACGSNYVDNDKVNELFNKIMRLFHACEVRVVMIDELNHLVTETQRRRVLEVSNKVRATSIVGTAVNPLRFRDNSPEITGRFMNYMEMTPYVDNELESLLKFIEFLLPFSKSSHLSKFTVPFREGKTPIEYPGPAAFIQAKTKGSLRRIMRLILDAARLGIKEDSSHITIGLLERAWSKIQVADPDKHQGNNSEWNNV